MSVRKEDMYDFLDRNIDNTKKDTIKKLAKKFKLKKDEVFNFEGGLTAKTRFDK